MLKKLLCVFLTILFLFCIIPFSALADTTYSYTISVFNNTRLTDYLVIYTRSYGYYTNTNEYGTEVVVTNGIVTSVGGNNSYIPSGSNCFVVSGHGAAKEWLDANISIGMKASYTYNRVSFVADESTAKYAATVAREKAIAARDYASNACLIYDETADTRLAAAEAIYNSSSALTTAQAESLVVEYTAIAALYREREAAEYRGLWLRPTQKSTTEVENYVKQCYDAGINMICIETMYEGTMIYPTPEGSLFSQNPYFNGFDVLGAFVAACHRYGMELHCWTPVFYSCTTTRGNWSISVAAQKPEWQLKTNNGSALYSSEASSGGMVFLNPALDEVQDFLAETYTYILETYPIDGFQLDYIRYRDRSSDEDYGYDATTIAKFKEAYPQYNNYSITYNTKATYWNDWVNFRAAQVTKFVSRMRQIIDEVAPNVVLSADVGPSFDSAYHHLYQNASYWLEQQWLDMIHPMAYGSGMASYVQPFFNYADEGCMVVPGLGIFMDEFGSNDMISQTMEMQDIGCDGVIYFESTAFYNKNADDGLKNSLFTENSVAPAFDNEETIIAIMNRINARLQLAVNKGLISTATADSLMVLSDAAIAAANTNAAASVESLRDLRSAISNISSSDLRTRLKYDVGNAIAAAARDPEYDDGDDKTMIGAIPPEAENAVQLTIDGINRVLVGEDSSLNLDPYGNYNTVYAYCMLLKPTENVNVYTLVEAIQGQGTQVEFTTPITKGMVVAAFHTDSLGSGKARVELAKTVPVGSELTLFGIDVDTGTFTYLNAMLYVSKTAGGTDTPSIGKLGDINNDTKVDQYDYILAKRIHFETYTPTAAEKSRGDVHKDGKNDQYDYLLIKRAHFGTYVIG